MKKKQILFVLLAVILALSFTCISCEIEIEDVVGTWYYKISRDDFADISGKTEAELTAEGAPDSIVYMKLVLNADSTLEFYTAATEKWNEFILAYKGAYMMKGDKVITEIWTGNIIGKILIVKISKGHMIVFIKDN